MMPTVELENEPRFGEVTDAAAFQRAIDQARSTILHFSRAFSADAFESSPYLVKVPLARAEPLGPVCVWSEDSASGPELHLWLRVHGASDDLLFAHVVEAPKNFGLTAGDTYVLTPDLIEDWMLNVDGLVYGGYTLRLQRDGLPEPQRAEFDDYVGIQQFTDELP